MAKSDGTVFIDTRMDTSGFDSGSGNMEKTIDETAVKIQKILSNTEKSAKSKAASIAAIYRKQGLTQQEAFKKAWEEIERDTKLGSKKVNRHIQGIGTQSQKTSKDMVSSLSGAIKKLGVVIGSVFAVSKLIQFGKEAIELGSDLQEVQNVVDVTFTTMSDKVDEFAQNAAEAAGLSETMAKRYVGTFGAMAKAFGFAESEAFNMSTSLTQLAGDVASFYNLTQDEAYTKLKSVFTGETESLKDLGVVMTQNALDAFAMAEGYGKTTKQMTEQEKVALRYAFVLDQLSAASGDFERTSDGWANQMRILSLSFDTFKANIGQALINVFTPLLKVTNQIVAKMAQLSSYFVAFSELIVGKSTSGGGGSPGEALAEISGGYEDITDATNEASKAQKKYLSGLDEIRTFSEEDTGTSSISGIGGVSLDELSGSAEDEVSDTIDMINELQAKYPELVDFAQSSIATLKSIFSNFAAGDFFAAGQDVSTLVTDIFDFFSDVIESVEWEELGNLIGDFLAGVDWIGIIKSALRLKISIWEALAEVWIGAFETAPFETAFISAIAAMKFTGLGSVLWNKISTSFSATVAGKSLSFVPTVIISAIVWNIGFDIGKSLGKALFPEDAEYYDNFKWFGEEGFFDTVFNTDLETHFDAIKEMSGDFGGLIGILDDVKEKVSGTGLEFEDLFFGVDDLVEKAKPLIEDWFQENVAPWLTKEKWEELGNNAKDALSGKWKEFKSWWDESALVKWWNESIAPWFKKEKWTEMLQSLPDAFSTAFKGAANNAIEFLNDIIGGVETLVNQAFEGLRGLAELANKVPGVNIQLGTEGITLPKIPMLATGAVIPPNAPFLAMLGDQRHGTNIETPEALLRKVVREESGRGNSSGGILHNVVQINRRTLLEEMIEEAKLRQSITGRNPFDLA